MRTWSIFPQCNNLLVCALFLVVPFFTFSTHAPISPHPDGVQCHLPNLLGERISEETPKFIEFACSPIDGRYDKCTKLGGIGNTLIMFPAVYLAAMLSGRQIIIHDNSGLGNWCRALKCDFPFTSAMEELFTDLKTVKHVVSLTQNDFAYKLRKNTSIPDSIIGFRGMDVYATKWFHYAGPYASACVEHITGCDPKLIGCIERFAFQQLFPGGFVGDIVPSDVSGLTSEVILALLRNPYHKSPHFDAGVHIRAQTSHLELGKKSTVVDSHFDQHMDSYLVTFQQFERALAQYFFLKAPIKFNTTNATRTGFWPRVFISCDDVSVRNAFVSFLSNRTGDIGHYIPVYMNTTDIRHMKHIAYGNTTTVSQNIVDTALEWYALSLSRAIFAWRANYSPMPSTFMQSASRVSMKKPTKQDFKSTILHKNGHWQPSFDYVDDIE